MSKKLYFQLSDGYDVSKITMDLTGCMEWIASDNIDEDNPPTYTLEPIWLTDEEFNNLPEADL